jgi:metallo-beta-lactamase class B
MIARLSLLCLLVPPSGMLAQTADTSAAHRQTPGCTSCAVWNVPQRPFLLVGNTYYVGTHGLGAILVTSDKGHVLIDGALPESAPLIAANIQALGFHLEDVKLILNSHDHFDHAGGIAELQRLTGATVAASRSSASVLEHGTSAPDDPQYGVLAAYPAVPRVRVIADGEVVTVGPLALTAHATPGHTPGGTTWTWRSCEGARCYDVVYADSQTPVSADDFHFTRNTTYPAALRDFEKGFATLESLPCDILLTPHPDASGLWQRVAARDAGSATALVNTQACKDFAAAARRTLAKRVEAEGAQK